MAKVISTINNTRYAKKYPASKLQLELLFKLIEKCNNGSSCDTTRKGLRKAGFTKKQASFAIDLLIKEEVVKIETIRNESHQNEIYKRQPRKRRMNSSRRLSVLPVIQDNEN